jgi:hypothetical protein
MVDGMEKGRWKMEEGETAEADGVGERGRK